MISNKSSLVELVKKHALQFGDFTLASGQKSTYYIDCRNVTLLAAGAAQIGQAILELMKDEPFDAVGGLTMGADPILAAVLTVAGQKNLDLRGFIVRKEAKGHGTGKLIEGPIRMGDRVVIVEDVATTGGSIFKAIEAVEKAGCKVVRVVTVLDRLAGAAETFAQRGYPFTSLLTIRDLGL
ncbi:MAG: orotate phosphoribosyltransferase [Planctomycetota bacterium]